MASFKQTPSEDQFTVISIGGLCPAHIWNYDEKQNLTMNGSRFQSFSEHSHVIEGLPYFSVIIRKQNI